MVPKYQSETITCLPKAFLQSNMQISRIAVLTITLGRNANGFLIPFFVRNRIIQDKLFSNTYDDWRSNALIDTMSLDEENVQMCLDEFIYSDFGATIFGIHDAPGTLRNAISFFFFFPRKMPPEQYF